MIIQGTGVPGEEGFFHLPAKGFYESKNGKKWSNIPFTREQIALDKAWNFCWRHKITFSELKNQIENKRKMYLPKWVQNWLIENWE